MSPKPKKTQLAASQNPLPMDWRGVPIRELRPTVITLEMYEATYSYWYPMLFQRALRRTFDRALAEELATSALNKLYTQYVRTNRFRTTGHKIGNLLSVILTNEIRLSHRRQRQHPEGDEFNENLEVHPDGFDTLSQSIALSPDVRLSDKARKEAITRALGTLSRNERVVVICWMNNAGTHGYRDEACKYLGEQCRGNMGTWLKRAIAKLESRVELEPYRHNFDR